MNVTRSAGAPDFGWPQRLLGGAFSIALMAAGILWMQAAIDVDGTVCGALFTLLGLGLAGAVIHGVDAA